LLTFESSESSKSSESSESRFDRRRLFDFLVRCLDHFGRCGSILFRDIPVSALSVAELSILHSHRNFDWCFIGQSAVTSLFDLISESEQQRQSLSSLSDRESGLIADLTSRVAELSDTVGRLSAALDERIAAADARFDAAIRRETASLKSTFEMAIQNLVSAADSRCATQIDEQTAALNASLESVIQQEIASIDSKFAVVLQKGITGVEGRIEGELQAKLRTVVGHCESEIQRQMSATVSGLETAIAACGAASADAVGVEFGEEVRCLRGEIHSLTFLCLRDPPLDGIIALLGRRCGGNVIDKGVIVAGPGANVPGR
jgi:hypothetical protein